jgi:hypothetical protein
LAAFAGGLYPHRDHLRDIGTLKRLARRLKGGFATSTELMASLWRGPYWWLVPVVAVLLPAALIFVALQAMPIVAPFVYTLF